MDIKKIINCNYKINIYKIIKNNKTNIKEYKKIKKLLNESKMCRKNNFQKGLIKFVKDELEKRCMNNVIITMDGVTESLQREEIEYEDNEENENSNAGLAVDVDIKEL